nr:hypothetical protein [Tanacetum cinerariifolium]
MALHKTAKISKKQENRVAVLKKILEEDVDKLVQGEDKESYATKFANSIFLDEEDFGTRIEPRSHKENPEEVDDDEEEKKDKKKDDDDDRNDHALHGNSEERKYVLSLHKIHAVPFPKENLEEKMNRWMKENDKSDSFSKADFKYLNKNDIEDMYYLFLNKKVNYHVKKLLNSLMMFIRSRVIWEAVHDFQLGIESYQIKINLKEKRVIDLVEIVKFYDAMLERVLKEVKMKIFETEFLKKAPLLGELDLDIMKAYEREIKKRLRQPDQMRRWESFMNG